MKSFALTLFESLFIRRTMIIDLFQIDGAEHKFSLDLEPEKIELQEDEARLTKPVNISGTIRKGLAQTDVSGTIKGEIEIDCTRCLRPAESPLDAEFKAAFVTPENYTAEREAELRADDLDVAVFEGDEINLAELAREQILLNLPTRFLCKDDCRGLCPKCGVNLNDAACDCEKKEIDPRWRGLRELKTRD